jgi:NodT family efflux transporter outer membrane factor (OMF) lipoprotein
MPLPDLAVPLPAHWRNKSPSIAPAAPDLHDWWRRFDDAQLDAAIDQTLRSNLDAAQAVERLRAVRSLHGNPDAPFLPSLHLRTDTPVDPDASASFFIVGFDALWEFGLFGRHQGALRDARGQVDAAVADLRETRVSLVAEVARNWIDLRAAQHRLQLLTLIRDTHRQSLSLLNVRARLQLATPTQLAQAQAATAAADAALSEPRQAENAAAQHLALLLGSSEPDPAWLQSGVLPKLGAQRLTTVPADLLRTRPEIAQAEANVLRNAGKLGIARADMYPRIGLGGSLIWSTSTLTHRDAPTNTIASFGPSIDIPLLDWGLRQARKHAQDHLLKASVLAYRQAVLAGVAEVEIALGNLAQQRQREHDSVDAWQALTRAADSEIIRQQLGLASGIGRASSEIARDQAALDVIDARAARDLAYIALYKALGGAPELPTNDVAASPQDGGH